MITVATWNVLHRVHAENWYEDVTKKWPVEHERIDAIAARVAKRSEQIIALQEVSGDQLAALRDALPDRTIHTLRYPRVPRPKRIPTSLRDRDEYLVLVVDDPGHTVLAAAFGDDPGKGALVVATSGLTVVATHVSGDERSGPQLTRLAGWALSDPSRPAVLLGDFNADRDVVAEGLGAGFTVAELPTGSLPTRPRTSGSKSQFIDHVVTHGAYASDAAVESADGLSDHNPVRAAIAV
ncbi:endonuclease/exonuclease/phosphatase family protein [Nocardia amikacinitolerans]|uniref:endonuclease/exonuclease/phosphatase family protein n=1 Tax=Nocardia amikacinitolerans TaxID=756689 RepID=UPI0020A2BDF5|nr:endonuclease/exonuclease/phosphatase family protein [Nocardia amikacinitolerans]MCP2293264.1 Metal-dependent hydrolase, endonuclease/exonuclease/phosphatase family [Nocardia amikacinitolerans]